MPKWHRVVFLLKKYVILWDFFVTLHSDFKEVDICFDRQPVFFLVVWSSIW